MWSIFWTVKYYTSKLKSLDIKEEKNTNYLYILFDQLLFFIS